MSYSYDRYIKPLASTDTNLHIVDNDNIIKYTLNPFSILNVLVNNNTIRISVKSGRIIIIPFSTINESKLALPKIKTSIDSLTSKSPLFIGNDIKNYINNNQSSPFYYQDNIPVGTGTNSIKEGTLWYDSEYGYLYIYVFDGTYYQWVTAAGSVGDVGPIGATGSSGINGTSGSSGTSGIDGTSGTSGIDGTSGSSGIDGTSGTSGSSGTSGTSGIDGTSGSSGSSGQTPTNDWTLTGGLTVGGTSSLNGLTVLQEVSEVINSTPGATASIVVYDFSTGSNWYHSSATTNYTANFTNVPTDNNRAITTTIIINQGSTAYIPTTLQISGSSQVIKWAGGTASGTANQVDIVGFTFIRSGGVWAQVLGQINTFD